MDPSTRDTKTQRDPRQQADRERDGALERRRDRERRMSATQLAAPSTRTWRRSGTFSSSQ